VCASDFGPGRVCECVHSSVATCSDPAHALTAGGGDDAEGWCCGLTPRIFWAHKDLLLGCSSESEARECISRLLSDELGCNAASAVAVAGEDTALQVRCVDSHGSGFLHSPDLVFQLPAPAITYPQTIPLSLARTLLRDACCLKDVPWRPRSLTMARRESSVCRTSGDPGIRRGFLSNAKRALREPCRNRPHDAGVCCRCLGRGSRRDPVLDAECPVSSCHCCRSGSLHPLLQRGAPAAAPPADSDPATLLTVWRVCVPHDKKALRHAKGGLAWQADVFPALQQAVVRWQEAVGRCEGAASPPMLIFAADSTGLEAHLAVAAAFAALIACGRDMSVRPPPPHAAPSPSPAPSPEAAIGPPPRSAPRAGLA